MLLQPLFLILCAKTQSSIPPLYPKKGFHGDIRPNKQLGCQLFKKEAQQTTGINFGAHDNIPIETSGTDTPMPIDSFESNDIGITISIEINSV